MRTCVVSLTADRFRVAFQDRSETVEEREYSPRPELLTCAISKWLAHGKILDVHRAQEGQGPS